MTKRFKIGVVSDTHFCDAAQGREVVAHLLEGCFADVDAIFHAGDLVHPDVSLLFAGVPFYAVRGNNDPYVEGVPLHRVIDFAGFKIGLIHGWGTYDDLEERMVDYFSGIELDCLIYGHTHCAVCHKIGEMLVLNPGSPVQRRRSPYHSVALLYLDDNIHAEIINIDATRQIV